MRDVNEESRHRGLSEREDAAVQKVSHVLRVTCVRHHDDGHESRLYDVELGLADGTRVAMEITSLQQEFWHRARHARDQRTEEYEGASLARHWIVMTDAERVRMKQLGPELEGLLHDLERAGVGEANVGLEDAIGRLPVDAQTAARKLGSLHVHNVVTWEEDTFAAGSPRILIALSTRAIGTEGALVSSLTNLLADGHNQKKLARASDCDELHLFVDVEDLAGPVLAGGLELPPCPPDPTGTLTWLWAWTSAGDSSGLVFRARPGGHWERYNVHTGTLLPWGDEAA